MRMDVDSTDIFVKGLRLAARELDSLATAKSETFRYDAITESIIWDDELPADYGGGSEKVWSLRPIFRFRASLILGEPDLEWERYWQLAKQLFPKWIGFSKGRLNPATEVKEFLRKRIVETETSVKRMMANSDRRRRSH